MTDAGRIATLSRFLKLLVLCAVTIPVRADVYEVVRSKYYHGIPYELAHAQGPQAVPALIDLLGKLEERESWANVVIVLGMIGDDRATEPLIEFLERRFTGRVDEFTYRALLEVPTSLGLLARDPNSHAFTYLRDGTSREVWQSKNLSWSYSSLRAEDRNVLLVQRSITGLGFSGTETAREYLRGMQQSGNDSSAGNLNNVSEAIQTSEQIQALGYERFFDAERE